MLQLLLFISCICLIHSISIDGSTSSSPSSFPNGYAWGCLNISQSYPFCDPSLHPEERAKNLVSLLSLEEKLSLLGPDTKDTNVNTCCFMDAGVERLGIPKYMSLVEINSAVAAQCLVVDDEEGEGIPRCATDFPGPTGMASTFNKTAWRRKGEIISTEMRAFNNLHGYRGPSEPYSLIGLLGFGPNINCERDPRFGRNSELPGEDPYLTGMYAMHYVKGVQEGEDKRFYKIVAGLKHFDAYSVEANRSFLTFNISMYDLWDTYLRQYKYGFHPAYGNAGAVMCSYAGVNGVPSCANDYLLNQVAREHWKRPDVVVASDCGAVQNMVHQSHYASNEVDAAAKSLLGGTDLDLGDSIGYYTPQTYGGNGALYNATQQGLVPESAIDVALTRVMASRIRTGLFDPLDDQVYTRYTAKDINSTEAHDSILDFALQSLILLKNQGGILPLSAYLPASEGGEAVRLAVVGPHVNSTRDLLENYAGDQFCLEGGFDCVPTIGDVFRRMHPGEVHMAAGVSLDSTDTSEIPRALEAVRASDVVILTLGTGNSQEHEGYDRTDTKLPGLQEQFAQQVLAEGKPVIIVLVNGGIVSIDRLIEPATAIIEAWVPSRRGAEALYLAITGQANRWGRLPVTVYNEHYTEEVDFFDFSMSKPPGRTYRYYTGEPLWHFGQGLSYSSFALTCEDEKDLDFGNEEHRRDSMKMMIHCHIKHLGGPDGDDVVMVFHRASPSLRAKLPHPAPHRSLVAFDRVFVPKDIVVTLTFHLTQHHLLMTDEQGDQVLYAGRHYYDIYDGMNWASIAVDYQPNNKRDKIVVERVPRPPSPPPPPSFMSDYQTESRR